MKCREAAGRARRILREFEDAETEVDAARSGRTGIFPRHRQPDLDRSCAPGSAGLFPLASGPYFGWLSLTFIERLPGPAIFERLPRLVIRPLSVTIGRYDYRSGCVARRSAVDLPHIRRFEAIVRETAQGDCD